MNEPHIIIGLRRARKILENPKEVIKLRDDIRKLVKEYDILSNKSS